MIKFDVKTRFRGNVQFTAEIECETDAATSLKLGLAVKWAIKNKANLRGANLRGVDLRGVDLRGVDLADGWRLIDKPKTHHITKIGSESGTLEIYQCTKGWFIHRGCFSGSKDEFLAKVEETHGSNGHGLKYRALIDALTFDYETEKEAA